MKPKGLLIAVALLAVLGGFSWWAYKHPAGASSDKGSPGTAASTKLLTIPDDQFKEIKIAKVTGETIDLVKDGGTWRMTSPKPLPADQDAAGSMQSALANLNADKLVEEKPADLKAYGLETPTLDLQILRKDGKTDHLLIGDDTPTGSGSYAKLAGDARVFTVASTVKSTVDKRPEDLRDMRLFIFDSDKLTRVELAAKGPAIEFGKNGQSEWAILKPRPLRADGSAVDTLIGKLKDARMDLGNPSEDASRKFAAGVKVAAVTVTDSGGNHTLEIRRDQEKNGYAKSSTVEGIYKTNADLGEALDKGLDDFRSKKLFDFGFSDPSKVELKGVAYNKEGDKWKSGGKVMDNTTVQNVIDKLRDLSAAKFVEKSGGQPVFDATVTSKHPEKVTIFKQGTQYFAQREGEPSIYELDAKTVEDLEKAAGDVKEAPPEQPSKKK